jgi:hypothetical protein
MPERTREEWAREMRLRRAAKRQGLQLRKSRLRDKRAIGYGRWWIFDPVNSETDSGDGYGLTTQEVEDTLTGKREMQRQ